MACENCKLMDERLGAVVDEKIKAVNNESALRSEAARYKSALQKIADKKCPSGAARGIALDALLLKPKNRPSRA